MPARRSYAYRLTKSFDAQPLFEEVTFSLNPGERTGLIGLNGCGKTTLLRILAGEEAADSGYVVHDPDLRIGYLPQGFTPDQAATLGQVIGRVAGNVEALESELVNTAAALSAQPNDTALQAYYDDLLLRIQAVDVGRTASILSGLRLEGIPSEMPVRLLSGGQQTLLSLALVLLGDPQLLLLDEPINHLDIPSRTQFEQALDGFEGAVLAVVHDRYFIERFADEVWWVEGEGIRREMVK